MSTALQSAHTLSTNIKNKRWKQRIHLECFFKQYWSFHVFWAAFLHYLVQISMYLHICLQNKHFCLLTIRLRSRQTFLSCVSKRLTGSNSSVHLTRVLQPALNNPLSSSPDTYLPQARLPRIPAPPKQTAIPSLFLFRLTNVLLPSLGKNARGARCSSRFTPELKPHLAGECFCVTDSTMNFVNPSI